MSDPLVEGQSHYPCSLHKYVKTSSKLSSDGEGRLIYCPVCGLIGRIPV